MIAVLFVPILSLEARSEDGRRRAWALQEGIVQSCPVRSLRARAWARLRSSNSFGLDKIRKPILKIITSLHSNMIIK
jgi:hypothetical protein